MKWARGIAPRPCFSGAQVSKCRLVRQKQCGHGALRPDIRSTHPGPLVLREIIQVLHVLGLHAVARLVSGGHWPYPAPGGGMTKRRSRRKNSTDPHPDMGEPFLGNGTETDRGGASMTLAWRTTHGKCLVDRFNAVVARWSVVLSLAALLLLATGCHIRLDS